jgi:hypothetical protein
VTGQTKEPEWLKPLLSGYAEGMSDVEVCRELKITMKTFNEQYANSEGFRKLVDYGRMTSHAWWMAAGRKNLSNRDFVVPLWTFNMKNRFGWADKTEAIRSDELDGPTNLDNLRQQLQKALPRILKQFGPELADAKLLENIKASDLKGDNEE